MKNYHNQMKQGVNILLANEISDKIYQEVNQRGADINEMIEEILRKEFSKIK